MEEVVITGLGVVSCLGHDADTFWTNLEAGKSGISLIEGFDTSAFPVKFAGEIKDFDHLEYFSDRDASRTSKNIQFAVAAAMRAVKDSGLTEGSYDPTRAGVIVGSGMGGMEVFLENSAALVNKGPRRVSPFFVPMAIANMASGEIGIRLKWMGPNYAVVSACATANHSIMSAADQIRMGRADVMIAGGSEESVCKTALSGFAAMKAISTRNDAPEKASRPFDRDRDGFVLGEGAGLVVLESLSHAKARGAKIYARLLGYGASCDGYHMSAPREDGKGVSLALHSALKDANLSTSDIGYINTHGTSTPLGDVAEATAISSVFGAQAANLKINSTKSMVGHLLGAASGIEMIATVKSLQNQKVHPTINLENQDERIQLDCVANVSVDWKFDYAMSNSFGFGGHNSCMVIGRI
jgi:3-oxoacyl-[acyl-carrier-protein] synthase II